MIVILANKELNIIPRNENILVLNVPIELLDDYHLKFNNQIIEFDYLIAYDQSFILETKPLPFVKDGDVIITNWVGQSSIEHIYIGNFRLAIDDLFNN